MAKACKRLQSTMYTWIYAVFQNGSGSYNCSTDCTGVCRVKKSVCKEYCIVYNYIVFCNYSIVPRTLNTFLPSSSSAHTALHDHKDETSLWWVYHRENKAQELVDLWVSRNSQQDLPNTMFTSACVTNRTYRNLHHQFPLLLKSEMQHHLVVFSTHCLWLTGLLAI